MVIPFLSLYLTESEGFTLGQVGWIMTCFGVGSLIGNWVGGRLTDIISSFPIMVASLLLTGIGFILIQFIHSYIVLCLAIFIIMVIADAFRPAMFVALSSYSKPENKTRSVTLIRLAINLGFSAGPAVGGFIIAKLSYAGLFWVDGITCTLAAILLLLVLQPKRTKVLHEVKVENPLSPFKDKLFWFFFFSMILYSFVFLQLFSTLPLYYKQVHFLSEQYIGLLMALNGLLIFILEMPIVKGFEGKWSNYSIMIVGTLLTVLGFTVLNLTPWAGILIISLLLLTFGEMITLPFSNSFALNRAQRGKQGEYMAFYSISFSISHILSHNVSMQVIERFGFTTTWWFLSLLGLICLILMTYTKWRWKV